MKKTIFYLFFSFNCYWFVETLFCVTKSQVISSVYRVECEEFPSNYLKTNILLLQNSYINKHFRQNKQFVGSKQNLLFGYP